MGKNATASLSYGFVISQEEVLQLLQKLQNSTKKVKEFSFRGGEPDLLRELLDKHLEDRKLDEFEMTFLTSGEELFTGLAILYKGLGDDTTVWGLGSRSFESSSEPWLDKERIESADAAFERLNEDSLFNDLEIMAEPEWLLGCEMTY